jgi:aromatic ring-opening dioxygenase catalytic subunit (LigB family)
MQFPSVFVNHGGGPLPLMGQQPEIVAQFKDVVKKWLPTKPDAIVVFSAHWESNPIEITSSSNPTMLYDYSGFPAETYKYQYPAPGSPMLAEKIQRLLTNNGIESRLNDKRGYDHGVFIPLMCMYPDAKIPVVAVSLHASLSAKISIEVGKALAPLRNDNILLLGSGYTYHNMHGFFHPSNETYTASSSFNDWLKETITSNDINERVRKLEDWENAPGARESHPREEHLLPLLTIAATASTNKPEIVFESKAGNGIYAISSYVFP